MIHRVTVTTCLAVTLSVVSPALAGVPDFVSYSGRLTDGTAWGQSTTLSLTFWLCESPQGDCGWSELHEAVSIEDGYFSVRLGEKEPLPTPLPEGLWITVAVAGGEPLGPREPVGSVPFALQAREVAPSGGESVLKAMKLALGFSDDPADPNYISDERFALNQRNAMTGDCPPDYERNLSGSNAQYVVCKKGQDEMVKVGDFWIDRYEMSVWENPDCTGQSYGSPPGCVGSDECDDYPDGFPNNGNWTVPVYACAIEGVGPSRSLTWFQAQQACGLAGKDLCTNAQWQHAAAGTPDPHTTDPGGDAEPCNIWPGSKPAEREWATENQIVKTQSDAACVSNHGAYDMVGNLWEWTADWWGQGEDNDHGGQPNDGDFHVDGYWNMDAAQHNGTYDEGNPAFPASAFRGGYWGSGSGSGVFALNLYYGPAYWNNPYGARCCLR